MKPVTVSIVSHQQMHWLGELLNQLARHGAEMIEAVVLTSNVPESMDVPTDHLPFAVRRVINAQAQGFGANHNQAFKSCQTPWFLVMNPDVRWSANVVGQLLARAQERTAVLAPQEIWWQGEPIDHPRGLITPWTVL
jgi:N-acetylglucosaminyl-diphospho-decaprenol L-rhamnosyltransferase